jgi:hypothetical protein
MKRFVTLFVLTALTARATQPVTDKKQRCCEPGIS